MDWGKDKSLELLFPWNNKYFKSKFFLFLFGICIQKNIPMLMVILSFCIKNNFNIEPFTWHYGLVWIFHFCAMTSYSKIFDHQWSIATIRCFKNMFNYLSFFCFRKFKGIFFQKKIRLLTKAKGGIYNY